MRQTVLRSTLAKPGNVNQDWFHVDATDQVLGRLAVRAATVLMGKHKPTYTSHVDTGDFVVVTNAEKVRVTGNKRGEIVYQSYSYYPGGKKVVSYNEMQSRHPERIVFEAVRRMMPKSTLGHKMLSKLKVYAGSEHPHAAQNPTVMTV